MSVIEQLARTYCAVNPGKGSPVDGSYTEETYEGSWMEMIAMAEEKCQAGGERKAVTATVTRIAGGLADCKIRTQIMDGKAMDADSAPGNSRTNPCYSLNATAVPQPILTHKLADDLDDAVLEGLKALVNGANMGTKIPVSKDGGPVVWKTVKDVIGNTETELMKKIKKGVTSFYSPQVSLHAKYRVTDPSKIQYQQSCKIASPPGPFQSPEGKFNWLCLGTSAEVNGKECLVTDSYMLSGPDGWDKDIYSK